MNAVHFLVLTQRLVNLQSSSKENYLEQKRTEFVIPILIQTISLQWKDMWWNDNDVTSKYCKIKLHWRRTRRRQSWKSSDLINSSNSNLYPTSSGIELFHYSVLTTSNYKSIMFHTSRYQLTEVPPILTPASVSHQCEMTNERTIERTERKWNRTSRLRTTWRTVWLWFQKKILRHRQKRKQTDVQTYLQNLNMSKWLQNESMVWPK